MYRITRILIATLAVAELLAAAPKPDFSGTCKLDTQRSRYNAKVPAPKSVTLVVEHRDPRLRIDMTTVTANGSQNYSFELTTDGTEVTKTIDGQPVTAQVRWGDIDGTRLVLTIKQSLPSGTMETSRTLRLGDKGKILTTVLIINDSGGQRKPTNSTQNNLLYQATRREFLSLTRRRPSPLCGILNRWRC